MKTLTLIIMLLMTTVVAAQPPSGHAENMILVTIDGLRWQEVFRGLDMRLAENENYSERSDDIIEHFAGNSPEESAEKLMPFLHDVVFERGSVVGNRDRNSCARVTNPWYFSYPGYNEILTGKADPAIDSNASIDNPNVSFLEWLYRDVEGYSGSIAAFASWNVFPFILNTRRSGIPVNVSKKEAPESGFDQALNRLHDDIPSPWPTVRLDAFTHHFSLAHMEHHHPRVIYIAYGEPDDFAHDGHYDQYVLAANRIDRFINEIWNVVQSDAFYRNRTALFITVDHGRGEEPVETWQHHASKESLTGYMQALSAYEEGIVGSDAVWIAAMGPGVAQKGLIETASRCVGSNQIAATILEVMGLDYRQFDAEAGAPIQEMQQQP